MSEIIVNQQKRKKVNAEKNKALKVTPQWCDTTMLAWNNELIKGTSLHYITSRSANASASTSSTSMYTHGKNATNPEKCSPLIALASASCKYFATTTTSFFCRNINCKTNGQTRNYRITETLRYSNKVDEQCSDIEKHNRSSFPVLTGILSGRIQRHFTFYRDYFGYGFIFLQLLKFSLVTFGFIVNLYCLS
ncbi:unnamed protein product [Brugia pahangi]|uniref:Phlebovirus glycoprotein G2 fusion domain-containing protein n=1 Tax=Brugia pahangi TaxID=6280 RepID=A0A0N4SYH7_BRUPA|nr:unnamed protein product [Brugia pahangi]